MTKARDISSLIGSSGQIDNAKITLDVNEIPSLTTDKIPNLDAGKITTGTFADARISQSSVSQHATSFDDNKIVNDISTLALRQASDQNKSAYNTNSQSVDVFQDATGIDTTTNAQRDANEYVSSLSTTTESGGTARNHSDYTFVKANNWTIGTDSATLTSSYNYTARGGDLSGNYKWEFRVNHSSMSGTSTPSSPSNNKQYQYGISQQGSSLSFDVGGSIYTNNTNEIFWMGFSNLGTSQDLIFVQGQTVQATLSNFNISNTAKFQFVRDVTNQTLKVYGDDVTDPYLNGTLLHTFTGYTDYNNADQFIYSVGYEGTTSGLNATTARNVAIKDNITTLGGSIVLNATGNFTGTTITAPSSVSEMGAIITYQDQAGTNALNTDIVLQLSADGGSNYSTATLTALPDFSTGIKMAKVNDLAVTAGTQLKYKISFANQASGSKEARIRGVALQY